MATWRWKEADEREDFCWHYSENVTVASFKPLAILSMKNTPITILF